MDGHGIIGTMRKLWANQELKSFSVFLFLSLFILLLDRFQLLSFVKSPLERLTLSSKKTIFKNYQSVIDRPKKNKENEGLKEKIKSLEQEIAVLQTQNSKLQTQNSSAQRLLGTPLPPEWQFLSAQTAGLVDGILTIDKGENDGVKVNQTVLVENIFVGTIKKVGKYQAYVKLPTAKNAKLLVKVIPGRNNHETDDSEAKAKGLLTGRGEQLNLEKVLQKEQLSEEDLVVTGEFPPNLVIGKIKKVIKNEVEIYQSAEVEPMLDYQKLETVFLLKN